jgi:hypothetical protein
MDPATGQQIVKPVMGAAAAPDWGKIPEEIHCPLCGYNLRGISEARCPECGYRFEWADLLQQRYNHPYLFELAEGRRIPAFFKTLVRNLEPGEFWKTLRPHMRTDAAGLFLYWVICAMLAGLPAILRLMFEVLDQLRSVYRIWLPQPGGNSWTDAIKGALAQDQGQILLVCFGMAVYPLLSAGALMLFHQSMNRAKVLPRHVMRIGIYSGDAVVWNGLWMLFAIFIQSWSPTPAWAASTLMPWVAFGILCTLTLTTFRIRSAYANYMTFPNPAGAALLSQTVVFLALAVSWIPLFQEGIETFRSLLW